MGDLTSAVDTLTSQNTTSYAYNSNGTVASVTDALGHITAYAYDVKGNLTRVTPPAPLGATTFTYDNLSRLATMTDGLGHTTTFTYDALDRVRQIAFQGGPSVNATYDADDNLLLETDPNGTTTYVYDALNQQTRKTLPSGAQINYTWDGEGNLLTLIDSGGTVTYTYNARDLVATLTEPGGAQTTFAYDANGRETARTYPNGVSITCTYDASGRLSRIEDRTQVVLLGYTYSYAKAGTDTGLRQAVTDATGAVTNYTYDALNRLTEAKTGTSADYQYSYDGVGNRLSQIANGVTTNYTYNAANELTAVNSTTYSHDANGNETGSSAGLSLSYNNANQTTSVTPPGGTATAMSYAGQGQSERVAAGGKTFSSGALGVASETTSGQTTSYVRDPNGRLIAQRRPGGLTYYYLFDGLGSVVGLTDSSGTVVNTYQYDPYGNVVSSTGTLPNPWGFAGGYRDSTGLIKFGERYLDPSLGAWSQVDPLHGDPRDPTTQNAYAYANDDPVNLTDPAGLCAWGTRAQCHALHKLMRALVKAVYDWLGSTSSELIHSTVSCIVRGIGGAIISGVVEAYFGDFADAADAVQRAAAGGFLTGCATLVVDNLPGS